MFNVTYDITTPESAENGDYKESGYICEGVSLREAIDCFYETRASQCAGIIDINANEWPAINPSWITVDNGGEYLTGAYESRSLHLPDSVTPSSKRRICRLLGINTINA